MTSTLKKLVALVLLFVIQYSTAWSQDTFAPVFLITADTAHEYNFSTAQYQILPDKNGRFSIDDVRNTTFSKQFFTRDKTPAQVDTLVNTTWYRYRVKNSLEKEFSVSLFTKAEHSDYYVFRNNQKSMARDNKENERKINHHGKRADAIVKGMLQHWQSSSGKKEPTDINALADEYLRLSYHGLRAKDKSLNAILVTDYDERIGNINIIPQDIGRVLLNLINNAFYIVNQKKEPQPNGYEPTVSVSTKKNGKLISIGVADNGNGIPKNIVDKIFQPFFTTKPTGEGTGLGLSLSYDIVKAHGGALKVDTKEGEGTEFVIEIPTGTL